MERRALVDTWQKITRDDFLKFGTFPQASFDTLVGKLLIPDIAFEGFLCVQSGPAELTVANGHLFSQGKVYVNDTLGGTTVDLKARLPAATKRIVAIAVWGQETDSKLEARTFLTDADTRATIARETATERWRWANIGAVSGEEGPDPASPSVAADVCVVAWITLTPLGIELVIRATDNLAPTLREEDNRLNAFDIWRNIIGTRIDTLASDLLALAAKLFGLAPFSFVRELSKDVARLKDLSILPQVYTDWYADHFLNLDGSDLAHVDWLASVEEGVRFPPAAVEDDQLGPLNPYDTLIVNSSNVLLPKWVGFTRITNVGTDLSLSISQYNYQTVEYVQKTLTYSILRYGTPFDYCSNMLAYAQTDWETGLLRYNGELYNLLGSKAYYPYYTVRVQKVWKDYVTVPYWDVVVTNHSVNGAVVAQTFVNSQDGWLNCVRLYFSQVAATGDVTCLITETTNGAPDFSKVLASSVKQAPDIRTAAKGASPTPTEFNFMPVFLGKARYAIVLVTAGNHFAWIRQDTNVVSGTFFYSTDGTWFQGELAKDLAFEIDFCRFTNNQTRVQLRPLQLQNGIASITVGAHQFVPDGCELFYEVQYQGTWYALEAGVGGGPDVILAGLPPILPFRAVFLGTEWVQPALGVEVNSRVVTSRPRPDMRFISQIRAVPSPVTTITADVRLEAWRGAPHHTFTAKLLHGATYETVRNADLITSEVAPDDPNAIIYHLGWTGMGALSSFRFRYEGLTDNVLTVFHIAEHVDIDIT